MLVRPDSLHSLFDAYSCRKSSGVQLLALLHLIPCFLASLSHLMPPAAASVLPETGLKRPVLPALEDGRRQELTGNPREDFD